MNDNEGDIVIQQLASFKKWYNEIEDVVVLVKIWGYIQRVAKHNFSRIKPINKGVYEIKIDFRSGYRIYFAMPKGRLVLLLILGGIKDTQRKDVKRAIEIYKIYKIQQGGQPNEKK
jgi:putative addiction module killer protein